MIIFGVIPRCLWDGSWSDYLINGKQSIMVYYKFYLFDYAMCILLCVNGYLLLVVPCLSCRPLVCHSRRFGLHFLPRHLLQCLCSQMQHRQKPQLIRTMTTTNITIKNNDIEGKTIYKFAPKSICFQQTVMTNVYWPTLFDCGIWLILHKVKEHAIKLKRLFSGKLCNTAGYFYEFIFLFFSGEKK